jgi:N-glycosylase/DNA lyase
MAMDIPVPRAVVKSRALEKAALMDMRPLAGEKKEKPWQAYAKEKNLCPVKIDYISN